MLWQKYIDQSPAIIVVYKPENYKDKSLIPASHQHTTHDGGNEKWENCEESCCWYMWTLIVFLFS